MMSKRCVAFFLFLSLSYFSAVSAKVREGSEVPDFTISHLESSDTSGKKDLNNNITLIYFWASWCSPPHPSAVMAYQKIHEKFEKKGLSVVGVNIDKEKQNAIRLSKKNAVSHVTLHDPEHKVISRFGAPTLPMAYLVDKKGKILKTYAGFRRSDINKIENDIELVLTAEAKASEEAKASKQNRANEENKKGLESSSDNRL